MREQTRAWLSDLSFGRNKGSQLKLRHALSSFVPKSARTEGNIVLLHLQVEFAVSIYDLLFTIYFPKGPNEHLP